MAKDWRSDLEVWLTPFLAALRHKTRMRVCPAYIAGLIGPGDRKSVQPMAARGGEFGYDQLHHFVADGVWDKGGEQSGRAMPLVYDGPFSGGVMWTADLHGCIRRRLLHA